MGQTPPPPEPVAWQPKNAVLNTVTIEQNVTGFISDNQAAVIEWAATAAGADLDKFPAFNFIDETLLAPNLPNLPSLAVTGRSENETPESRNGDAVNLVYQIGFESIVFGRTPASVSFNAAIYARALQSLLVEIPKDILLNGVSEDVVLEEPTLPPVRYQETGISEKVKGYIKVFQIQMNYEFSFSRYN